MTVNRILTIKELKLWLTDSVTFYSPSWACVFWRDMACPAACESLRSFLCVIGYYKDRSCFMKMYTTMSAQVNGALKNKETPLHGTSMWTTNWESSSLATWWWWVYLFYVWILLHFMYSFKRSVLSNLVILFKRCSNPFQPIGKRSSSKVEHKLILSPHAFHFF